jgi:hypothetical protein
MTTDGVKHFYLPGENGNLSFWVEATPVNDGCACEFVCYDCVSIDDSSKVYYFPTGKDNDETNDPNKAVRFLIGRIKWDGCADLMFFPDNDRCQHFCGPKDAKRVGQLVDRLYQIAKELIPRWDGDD